jgi:glycerophosphoryl diester phosphodiesterase
MDVDRPLFTPQAVAGPLGLIAHALGGIDGLVYSNCREAFLQSCDDGYRLIEVDLAAVRDGNIVCFHELDGGLKLPRPLPELTREEFMALRYAGRFTPLDLDALLDLFAARKDLWLITDTKNCNRQILPAVIAAAEARGQDVLSRIIPQAYSREDIAYVRGLGCFGPIIFTCYLCDYNDDQLVALAASGQVAMMAMFANRFNPTLRERLHAAGCGVYVHTVNDPAAVAAYRAQGVGVYTDFCSPFAASRDGDRSTLQGTSATKTPR